MIWKENYAAKSDSSDLSNISFMNLNSASQKCAGGRISRSDNTRVRLLKLKYDDCRPITSCVAAVSILRDIKNAPKRKRETSEFVHEIRRRLFVLRDFNDQVTQVKGRAPYSKQLFLLLVGYAKLEYDALYSKKCVSSTHEKEVQRIVLHLLQTMFCSYDYNTIRYVDSKVSIHSAAKCALRVLNKLSKEYWEEGKLIHSLGILLMKKLGILDVVTKIKESKELVLLDSLWNSPIIQSLSEGHFEDTSDCDSDNADSVYVTLADDSSSCASSAFIKKDDFESRNYIKSDFEDFKFKETQKEPVVHGENRVPTIDLVHDDHDEEEYFFYMSSEVKPVRKKPNRQIKVCYDSDYSSDYTDDKKLDLSKDFLNLDVHIVHKDMFNEATKSTNINDSSATDDLTLSVNRDTKPSKASDNLLHNVRSELLSCSNYSHDTEVIVINDDDDGVLEVFEDNTLVTVYKQKDTSSEDKSDLVVNIENMKPLELVDVIDITSDDEEALLGADYNDNDCSVINDNENDILDKFSDECANNIVQQPPTAVDNQVNEISSSDIFDNEEPFGHVPEEDSNQGNLHSNTSNSTYMKNNSSSYCERTARVARPDVPNFNVEITSTTGKSYESINTEPRSLCSVTYKQPQKNELLVPTNHSNCTNVQVAPLHSDLHEVDPVCSQNGNAHFKTRHDKTETDNDKTESTQSSVCSGAPRENCAPAYPKNKVYPTKTTDISTNMSSCVMSKYFSKLNLNSAMCQINVNEDIGTTTAGNSFHSKEEVFTQAVNQVSSHKNILDKLSDIVTKKDKDTVCVTSNTACGSHISFSSIRTDKTPNECVDQGKSNKPHKDCPEVKTDIRKNCDSNLIVSVHNDKKFHLSLGVHSSTQIEMLYVNPCVLKNVKEIPVSDEKHLKIVDDFQEDCELDMHTNSKRDDLILVDNKKTERLHEMVKITQLCQSGERDCFPNYGGVFINREDEKLLPLTENCEVQGNCSQALSQNGVFMGLDVDHIVIEDRNNIKSVISETESKVTTTSNKEIQTIVEESIDEIVTESKKVQKVGKPKTNEEGVLANAMCTIPIPVLLTECEPNVITDNEVNMCENSANERRNVEVLKLLSHENDTMVTVEGRIDVDAINESEISKTHEANEYDLQIASIQVSDTDNIAGNEDIISINRENDNAANEERNGVDLDQFGISILDDGKDCEAVITKDNEQKFNTSIPVGGIDDKCNDKTTAPHSSESTLNATESISIRDIQHNKIENVSQHNPDQCSGQMVKILPHTTERTALVDTEKCNVIGANQTKLEIALLNVNNSPEQLECVNIAIINESSSKCDKKTSNIGPDNQTLADMKHFSESSVAVKPGTGRKHDSVLKYYDNITAVPESDYMHDICEEINFESATVSVSNTQECENKVTIENTANMQEKLVKICTSSEDNLECSDYTKAIENVVASDDVNVNVKDNDTKIENDCLKTNVNSVEEQSANSFEYENIKDGVELEFADVINVEENNGVTRCETYSNHSDDQNVNITLNKKNLQVNEEILVHEASAKPEGLINDFREDKHCNVNITNKCSEILCMENKKESCDNNANSQADDTKKFRGNKTRAKLKEFRTVEEQTEEEGILNNTANTDVYELKSNNEKVFVASDNCKVPLEEIYDHSVCDADPCPDQLGIYVISEDDNKEVTANTATDTKLLLVTNGFDNGNEEQNTSVSVCLTVGENIIVESLGDVHVEAGTSNERLTVTGIDDNNINEQSEELCVAPPKVQYEQTETEKSSEGNDQIHQFRNLSSVVQSHECYVENMNNCKELRANNEDDCAAEVQGNTTRCESCEVENEAQGIYSDCEVFYNLEDCCQNMEITVAEVTITTENSDFVPSENAVLPQCESLLSAPVELENNSDNIEKESNVILDHFRSAMSEIRKSDEYIPQKTDFVALENGVLPHCKYTLNTTNKIENDDSHTIENESAATLANYKSVQSETYKTDECLPKETENLDVLAEAACIRKTLEVKTSVSLPISIGDNKEQNQSGFKITSKQFGERKVKSHKTKSTQIRKSLPRAAKINAPVDYCNDGFKIRRNTNKNAIFKAAQDRCSQLNKTKMKCKPNDFMENVSEQPPNKIYAAEYNADFNTVSDDSCDSTVGLVIAEDIKPSANCTPLHGSNIIPKLDMTMFDENTVDNKLVPIHSELVDDDVSSVLISIPECEDYNFPILQDVEQIKASPSSAPVIHKGRQELLVCKKLFPFEGEIDTENNSESLLTVIEQQNKQDELSVLNPLNVQQESEKQEELSVMKFSASVLDNKLTEKEIATETLTEDSNKKQSVCVDSTSQFRSSIKNFDHRIETILSISVPSTSSEHQIKNREQNMKEVGDVPLFSNYDNKVQDSAVNFRMENKTSECESVLDLSVIKRGKSVEGEINSVPYMLSHDGEILNPNYLNEAKPSVRETERSTEERSAIGKQTDMCVHMTLNQETEDVPNESRDNKDHSNGFTDTAKLEVTDVLPIRTKAAVKSYMKDVYVRLLRIKNIEALELQYVSSLQTKKIGKGKHKKTPKMMRRNITDRNLRSKSFESTLKSPRGGFFNESKEQVKFELNDCEMKSKRPKAYASGNQEKEEIVTERTPKVICNENVLFSQKNDIAVKDSETRKDFRVQGKIKSGKNSSENVNHKMTKNEIQMKHDKAELKQNDKKRNVKERRYVSNSRNNRERMNSSERNRRRSVSRTISRKIDTNQLIVTTNEPENSVTRHAENLHDVKNKKPRRSSKCYDVKTEQKTHNGLGTSETKKKLALYDEVRGNGTTEKALEHKCKNVKIKTLSREKRDSCNNNDKEKYDSKQLENYKNNGKVLKEMKVVHFVDDVINKSKLEKKDNKKKLQLEKSIMLEFCLFKPDEISTVKSNHDRNRSNKSNRSAKKETLFKHFVVNSDVGVKKSETDDKNEDWPSQAHIDNKTSQTISSDYENLSADLNGSKNIDATDDIGQSKTSPARDFSSDTAFDSNSKVMSEDKHKKSKRTESIHMNALKRIANNLSGLTKQEINSVTVNAGVEKTRIDENVGIKFSFDEDFGNKLQIENKIISSVRISENVNARRENTAIKTEVVEECGSKSMECRESNSDMLTGKSQNIEEPSKWSKNNKSKTMHNTKNLKDKKSKKYDKKQKYKVQKEIINEKSKQSDLIQPEVLAKDLQQKVNCVSSRKFGEEDGKDIYQSIKENDATTTANGSFKHSKDLNKLKAKVTAECEETKRVILKVEDKYDSITSNSTGIASNKCKIKSLTISEAAITDKEMTDLNQILDKQSNIKDNFKEKEKCDNTILKCIETELNKSKIDSVIKPEEVKFDEGTLKMKTNITDTIKEEEAINQSDSIHLKSTNIEEKNKIEPVITSEKINRNMEVKCDKKILKKEGNIITKENRMETVEKCYTSSLKSSSIEESETKIGSVIKLDEVNTHKETESEGQITKKETNIIEREETAEKIKEIKNNKVLTRSEAASSDELTTDKEMHFLERTDEKENSAIVHIAEKETTVQTVAKSDSCSLKSAGIKEMESVIKTEAESVMTSGKVNADEEMNSDEQLLNKEMDTNRIEENVIDNCSMKVVADEKSIKRKRRLTTDQLEEPKKHQFEPPLIEKLEQSVRNKMKQAKRERKTLDLKRCGGESYLTKAKESNNKRKSIDAIINNLRGVKETYTSSPVKNAAVVAKDVVDRRKSKKSKNTQPTLASYKSDNAPNARLVHEESIENLHQKSETLKDFEVLSVDASLTELNVKIGIKDIEIFSNSESDLKFDDHIQGVQNSDAHTEKNSENDVIITKSSVNNPPMSQSLVMEKISSDEHNVSLIGVDNLVENANKLIASEAINHPQVDPVSAICEKRVEAVPSKETAITSAIVETQEVECNVDYEAKNELVRDLADTQVEIINPLLQTDEINENTDPVIPNVELNNDVLVKSKEDMPVLLELCIINQKFSSGCDNSRQADNYVDIKKKRDSASPSPTDDLENKTHAQSIYDTSSDQDVLALSSIATEKDHVMLYTKKEINDSTVVNTPSSYLSANKYKDNCGVLHKIVTPIPYGENNGIISEYTENEINDELIVSTGPNEELNATKVVTQFLGGGNMTHYNETAITAALCAQTESTNSLYNEDETNDSAIVSTALTYAKENDTYGVFLNKMPSSLAIPPNNDATSSHTKEEIRDGNLVSSPLPCMSTESDFDKNTLRETVSEISHNEKLPTLTRIAESVIAPTLANDGGLDGTILISTSSTYLTTSNDLTQSSYVSQNVPVSVASTVNSCPVKLLKESPPHITVPVSNGPEFISAHWNVIELKDMTKNCDADGSKYEKAYSAEVLTSSTKKSIAASTSEISNFVSSDATLSTIDERNFTDTCKIIIDSNKDNVITSTSAPFLSQVELVSFNKQCDGIFDKTIESSQTKCSYNADVKAMSNVHMTEITVSSCTSPISNQMQVKSGKNLQTISPEHMCKPTELQNTRTETDAFLQRNSSLSEDKHQANVPVMGHSLVKSDADVMLEKYDNKSQNASSAALSAITSQVSNFENEVLRSAGEICDKELTSAVGFENDEQVTNQEIACDSKNRTIQIILKSIDHNYSLGGPFLCGEYENNELNQSAKDNLSNVKRHNEQGSREDLNNSPVDNEQMFHFAEQVSISSLIDNNLSQSSSRSLDGSPVDSTNDYQLSEHDSQLDFSFIDNQETTQSLDESTNIHDTNEANQIGIGEFKNEYELYMKQEREDEHRNLNSLIEEFNTQGGFECNTLMSVEKMNKLLHSNPQADDINTAIANLNNLLSNTQNQMSEKDKSESLYQHDDSTSSNECTVSSGCGFAFDGLAKLRVQSVNPLTNLDLHDKGNIKLTTDTTTSDLISSRKHSRKVPSNNSNALSTVLSSCNISEPIKSENLNVLEKVTVKYNMHDFASADNIFSEAQHLSEVSKNKNSIKLRLPLGNKSESTKLAQISVNKPVVKELPKIWQVVTKEITSTSIENVTKDKLNKLLPDDPVKKSFIKLRQNKDVMQKSPTKYFTDLKLSSKQPPKLIKEAGPMRQGKIDLETTKKLIDSYSYEKRLKVEEKASGKYKASEKPKTKPTAPAGHVPIFDIQDKKSRKRLAEDEDSNNSCKSKRSRKKVKSLFDYDESSWSDDLGKSKQTNALQKDSSSTSDDDIDKIKKEDRMRSKMDFNALFDQLRQEGDVRGKNVEREDKKREEPEYQEKKVLSKELDAKGNYTNNNRTEKKLPPDFRAFENLPKCSNGYTPDIHTNSFPNRLEKHVKSTNQSKNYSTDSYVHVQNSACRNQMRESEGHRYSHPDYRDRFSRSQGNGSHSSRYPSFPMKARHGGSSSNRRSSDYMHSRSSPLGHHSSSYSNSRRSQLRRGEKIDLTTFLSHHSKISKTNNDKHRSDCDWLNRISQILPPPNVSFQTTGTTEGSKGT